MSSTWFHDVQLRSLQLGMNRHRRIRTRPLLRRLSISFLRILWVLTWALRKFPFLLSHHCYFWVSSTVSADSIFLSSESYAPAIPREYVCKWYSQEWSIRAWNNQLDCLCLLRVCKLITSIVREVQRRSETLRFGMGYDSNKEVFSPVYHVTKMPLRHGYPIEVKTTSLPFFLRSLFHTVQDPPIQLQCHHLFGISIESQAVGVIFYSYRFRHCM